MGVTILLAANFPAGLRDKLGPSMTVMGPCGLPVGANLTAGEAARVRVLITMGTMTLSPAGS
jgi:hypothetical protein